MRGRKTLGRKPFVVVLGLFVWPLGTAGQVSTLRAPDDALSVDDLVRLGVRDLDEYWRAEFDRRRWYYEPPSDVQRYDGPVRTACGDALLGNAFYCARDHGIYYDIGLLRRIHGTTRFGDFGTLTVLAHEWSHAVQARLAQGLRPAGRGAGLELQADCLAGSYAHYLHRGTSRYLVLEEGDLQEGASFLYSIGDDLPWFDPQAHGSPFLRSMHFIIGLTEGLDACLPARRFVDPGGAFEIEHPRTWTVAGDRGWNADATVFVVSFMTAPSEAERAELHGYLSEGIRITMELPRAGYSWTEAGRRAWEDGVMEATIAANPTFRVTRSSEIAIGGRGGMRYWIEGTDERIREPERTSIIAVSDPAFRMIIELASPASRFTYYQHRLDLLAGTLRILSPEAPPGAP